MRMTAKLPGGSEIVLLGIEDWDFDWQDRYLFAQPVRLPAGTVLETVLIYDRPAENPNNPFTPPRRVRWGHESTDEMGSITVLASPVPGQSEKALANATKKANIEVLGSHCLPPAGSVFPGAGAAASRDRCQLVTGSIESTEIPELHRNGPRSLT